MRIYPMKPGFILVPRLNWVWMMDNLWNLRERVSFTEQGITPRETTRFVRGHTMLSVIEDWVSGPGLDRQGEDNPI